MYITNLISKEEAGRSLSWVIQMTVQVFQLCDGFLSMLVDPGILHRCYIKTLLQQCIIAMPTITLNEKRETKRLST